MIITELHWKGSAPFSKGLDLEFRGPLTCLVGREGAGKTTLLRSISGRRSRDTIVSFEGKLILLDEPENGLSMDSVMKLRTVFNRAAKRNQLIISTHHPFLIAHRKARVFDLDRRQYIDGRAYVESILKRI